MPHFGVISKLFHPSEQGFVICPNGGFELTAVCMQFIKAKVCNMPASSYTFVPIFDRKYKFC